jgi:spermidine synthase
LRLVLLRVAAIVFFANAALLVLQLIAGRLLAPLIGVSLETWTAVIGVFLAGISLGNAAGSRLASTGDLSRTLQRLLLYGAISILVSFALAKFFVSSEILRPIPILPRIACACLAVCFLPAFVLSLITPVAIQLASCGLGPSRVGRVVGVIYALGTLGSLLGNFLTGFVLIAYLNTDLITLATAATILLLALFAPKAAPIASEDFSPTIDQNSNPLSLSRACFLVFVASFCSMAMELTASRILAPHLGVSLYTWTGIIGVVLAAIVLGNSLGGFLADRINSAREFLRLSLLLAGLAILAILPFEPFLKDWEFLRSLTLIPRILLWAFFLFFIPMLLLATITPLVTRLAIANHAAAGATAGQIYAWSCAGAIFGTFATGWFLISSIGVFGVVLFASAFLLLLPMLLGGDSAEPRRMVLWLGVFAVAGFFVWYSDKWKSRYALETNYFAISFSDREIDGQTVRYLALDNLQHSLVRVGDPSYLGYPHENVQAEFVRVIAEKNADPRLLVIGGGGYTLPCWVEAFEPTVHVDVVEIDPGVTQVAKQHLNLSADTKIVSYHCDGRQFIQEQAVKGSYPLIIQDAVNDFSVPFHILTKEYNDAIKSCMTPDGVYLLTVIDDYEEGLLLRAAVRTMQKTFKHVQLAVGSDIWTLPEQGSPIQRNVFVIYGSDQPMDLEKMSEIVKKRSGKELQTKVQPQEQTDKYLTKGSQIVLTDIYAPVDNLMTIVYRKR